MENSHLNVDKDKDNIYFIKEHNFRLPHEHDIKEDITFPEISDKYKRRFYRLKELCEKSEEVIFIRVVAHRCYNLTPETESQYSDHSEYVRVLNKFCGHSNYKLCLLSETGWASEDELNNKNIAKYRLELPFENGFFDLVKNKEKGSDAISVFSEGLNSLRNHLADNSHELKYPFSI